MIRRRCAGEVVRPRWVSPIHVLHAVDKNGALGCEEREIAEWGLGPLEVMCGLGGEKEVGWDAVDWWEVVIRVRAFGRWFVGAG